MAQTIMTPSEGYKIKRNEINYARLDQVRRNNYLTLFEWADYAKVSRSAVTKFVSGKHRMYLHTFKRLLAVLDLTLDDVCKPGSRVSLGPVNYEMIKAHRMSLGLTKVDVSMRAKVNRLVLWKLETGKPISSHSLGAILDVLELSYQDVKVCPTN